MRSSLQRPTSTIAKLFFPKSNFSTIENVKIPDSVSEQFRGRVEKFYEPFFQSSNCNIRPFSSREAKAWRKELEKIITKEDPRLLETLEQINRTDSMVIMSNVAFPEISESEVLTSSDELKSFKSTQKDRSIEAILHSYSHILGVNETEGFYYLFADKDEKNPNSYKSSQTLKWHNDGWGSGEAARYIVLGGLYDNKTDTKTKLITYDNIVSHFVKNDKQHLLDALSSYFYVDDTSAESLYIQAKILDEERYKINYSQYGDFRPVSVSGGDLAKEAISFLNQSLAEISATSIKITPGIVAKINNDESLHTKEVKPGAKLVGERMGARIVGDRKKDDSISK
ncbi:MAG: hypothetical protein KGQ36_02410 [Rickettsiales bacterium]|nr:hypothetical protein [Rickettsiales bacterium]